MSSARLDNPLLAPAAFAPEGPDFPEEAVLDKVAELFHADCGLGEALDAFARRLIGPEDMKERLIFLRQDAENRAPDALADEQAEWAGA